MKNKKKQNIFTPYPFEETLGEEKRAQYEEFIRQIDLHLALGRHANEQIRNDFNAAIQYYLDHGVSLEDAFKRLNPEYLGGFYVHRAVSWYPLDNAAIIYPLSMRFGQMPVFRLSCYLKEEVVPEILQMALTFTIKRFPSFATTVKHGFFWHYLDSTKRRYVAEEEKAIPCLPIAVNRTKSQSFRVLYYKNKISVEFFHVLTDGSGGMIFLKTLVAEYLRLLGHEISCTDGVYDINGVIDTAELENEFKNTEKEESTGGFMGKKAVQMSGKISEIHPCQVLHFEMSASQLKKVARSKGVTVTSYLLSLMLLAIKYSTEETSGTVSIQVPVNMRKYNQSKTIRNYAMYFSCSLPLEEITKAEDIYPKVAAQVKERSSYPVMKVMMSTTIKLVQSLKMVPLIIKRPVAQIVYGFLGDRIFTSFLSNLGVITLPKEMEPYVEKLDFVLGVSNICRTSTSLVTYGDKAVYTISKITMDPTFEETMLKYLEGDGIRVRVTGTQPYEN
ncbi:MAG: hypothetical protein IKE59_04180 [Erysipelotrichaceae bacterium]|nr:hypothetical protein [Erysipelotrichaceae bacterium]